MNEERVRKISAGIALMVTPALALAAWLLWPVTPRDGANFVEDTARYGDVRVAVSICLGAATLAVGVVAIFALIHILREKRGLLGLFGGGLAIMGSVLLTTQIGVAIAGREIVTSGIPQPNQEFIVQRFFDADMLILLYIAGAMLTAGLLLLAANLLIARAVPWPVASLVAVFALTQAVGYAAFNAPTILASTIVMFLAFVPIGMKVLTESEEEWEHPPTFIGFRPENGHRELATELVPAMAKATSRATARTKARTAPAPRRRTSGGR
jgi:hypothetical protein